MFELFEKYYVLFNWENGENTCLEFIIGAILISALIIYEIVCKMRKRKSMFF